MKTQLCLRTFSIFVLAPPPLGGPGGGSGQSRSFENQNFWADSGPDPEGKCFLSFCVGLKRSLVMKRPMTAGAVLQSGFFSTL